MAMACARRKKTGPVSRCCCARASKLASERREMSTHTRSEREAQGVWEQQPPTRRETLPVFQRGRARGIGVCRQAGSKQQQAGSLLRAELCRRGQTSSPSQTGGASDCPLWSVVRRPSFVVRRPSSVVRRLSSVVVEVGGNWYYGKRERIEISMSMYVRRKREGRGGEGGRG
jgi:hypothetical protein